MEGDSLPAQDSAVGDIEVLKALTPEQEAQCFDLYKESLGKEWPLSENKFQERLLSEDPQKVQCSFRLVSKDGHVVGFSVGKYPAIGESQSRGSVSLVLVKEEYRRRGLGRAMVDSLVEEMRGKGIYDAQLGAGSGMYLWPGVPDNLPGAQCFFETCGWSYPESSVDMVCEIGNYEPPEGVPSDYVQGKIDFVNPDESMAEDLLTFERTHFPNWYPYYEGSLKERRYQGILVARTKEGAIVGSTLLARSNAVWAESIGGKVGTFGAIGVSEDIRKHGVGMALASESIKVLRQSGAEKCYIGWTDLVDWYAKLGFTKWRTYKIAWRKLQHEE
jgi:GNAT superfamily N-acetyltransferase